MTSAVPMNESEPPPARNESTQPREANSELPLAGASTEAPPGSPTNSSGAAGDLSPRPTEPGETPAASEAALPSRPPEPRYPLPVVAVLGVMAVSIVAFSAWSHWFGPAVDRLQYPLETALRIVERGMEFREATRGAGPAERALLWLGGDSPELDAEAFPAMYREILRAPPGGAVAQTNKTWLQAHLIVLLGELGKTNDCRAELESFSQLSTDSRFVAAVRRVYLLELTGTSHSDLDSATNSLSAGWTRDRFAARLAEAEGRMADARGLESDILARAQRWHHRTMTSLTVYLAMVVAAFLILAQVWRRGGIAWCREPDNSLAPWPFSDGIAVLFASLVGGLALAVLLLVASRPVLGWVGGYWYSLLLAVPAVVLVRLCLLRPYALRFLRHFGIEFSWRALIVALGGATVIAGLFVAASQVVGRFCEGLGLAVHWTEGLDESLLYEAWPVKLAVLVNMSLVAPFVEELLVRGVLFGTLRKRMGLLAAAAVSSAVFAFIHHYSLVGTLAVFCFGFVCALVYERTRNLGVCVAGHMLTNLLIGLFEIAMLG